VENTQSMNFNLFVLPPVFYTSSLVLISLSRMELLRGSIDILLTWA
jgi:hypothetical protein